MSKTATFLAGLAAGAVLTGVVTAHAGWNDATPPFGPDRSALETIARASDESAARLRRCPRRPSAAERAPQRRCRPRAPGRGPAPPHMQQLSR